MKLTFKHWSMKRNASRAMGELKIYLYVKTHNKTGLKYFGKTTKADPISYVGSGLYWKRHLSKYGSDFSTEIIGEFYDTESCYDFAIKFSEEHDIVNSPLWANLIIENGMDGAPKGNVISEETKEKIKKSLTGKPSPKSKYILKESPLERAERISKCSSGRLWITNGEITMRIKEDEELPDGFVYGRIKKDVEVKEKLSMSDIMKNVWKDPNRKEKHKIQMEERVLNGFYESFIGMKRSDKFCAELSERMTTNNPMSNPEHRKKLKESLSSKETIDKKRKNMIGNTYTRGRKWFNNGEVSKMLFEAPDETWKLGRLHKKEQI